MIKLFYTITVGVIGALIVHLSIIFMLPSLSENSAWRVIDDNVEIAVPVDLSAVDLSVGQNLFLDPAFTNLVCKYDLTEGSMRITAQAEVQLWTAAAINSSGTIFFSANNRIATSQNLDLVVVNATQLRFARQNTPDILTNSIVAAADSNDGYVLIRVFSPDESWQVRADSFFETMQCDVLTF